MFIRKILVSQPLHVKFFSVARSAVINPVVAVKEGKLKGSIENLLDGGTYYSFKGVPYAQPPVGNLRFKAPLPLTRWEGVRDAINHGAVCPQYDIYTSSTIEGSEDCLFLNVYTKSLEPSAKLPVMVFIHGGAFSSGSGNSDYYGPEFLCQHDVIVITFNYRLEVLGFLCLDTPDVPGNAGMKDQVLALKWVQENVSKFGGDPNNITLFGESAGAASVTYHMLSPMSRGLFHKAIAQSGTCTQDWAIASAPRERAFRVGKLLGKNTNDPTDLANFLRTVPAVKLTKLTLPTRTDDEKFRGLPMHFVPVTEKKFDNVVSFISEDPLELLIAGKIKRIPFIIGYNSAEGLALLADHLKKANVLNERPSFLLPKEIVNKLPEEKVAEMGRSLIQFYLGDKGISKESSESVADMQTDRIFAYHSHRFAHYYSALKAPTYMYKFDYDTELNLPKKILGCSEMKGASHGDELFYLFSTTFTKEMYKKQDNIRDAVCKVTKLWTDFAKTGSPTPGREASWPRLGRAGGDLLLINAALLASARADCHRITFWNNLHADAGLPSIVHSSL